MKTSTYLLTSCLLGSCLLSLGCSDDVPGAGTAAGHVHHHDHKHGPNGYPIVDMDDGTEIEWDFDRSSGGFLLIAPTEMSDAIESVTVKAESDGTETDYAFEKGENAGVWSLVDEELGATMMLGDAAKRTLMITTTDGKTLTAAVAHFEGH
ncbi:MAG: hypothetical protein AAGG48_26480 [Planctomycetota bacterium]